MRWGRGGGGQFGRAFPAVAVDDAGRLVRGKSATPTVRTDAYDSMVVDPWSRFPPGPVQIQKGVSIYDQYDVLEEIGTGAFGVVHRCVEKATGKVLAVKFVPTFGGEKEKETVRKEISTMSHLRHPALVSLHDAFEAEQELMMVYEFMSGGELFEKVSSSEVGEGMARKYIRQICDGLRHMHELSYVHLDLKPENIMFSTKSGDRLKIIDFGLATKIDPKRAVKVTTGTPEFAAPEVVCGKEVGFCTDMWSVGVLAYILLSGLSPFGGENDDETLENVRKCDWSMKVEAEFEGISEQAKDFIRQLLVADPRQRLTVHQALEHPWLAELRRNEEKIKIIPAKRFHPARDRVRSRYDAWPMPLVPMGRISQYSSLRMHQPDRFRIRDAHFDPNDARPRFVLRPMDGEGREGKSASFFCKVLSPTPIRLSWWKKERQLMSADGSQKYRQHNNANEYALTINDLVMTDTGEYMVMAQNEFGQSQCQTFLNVLRRRMGGQQQSSSIPTSEFEANSKSSSGGPLALLPPAPPLAENPVRRLGPSQMEVPRGDQQQHGPPSFTFLLRPRLIQKNHACKLLCTVAANPAPKIEWRKDGRPVDAERVQIMFKSGVASLEIFNTRLEDAGVYTCSATNAFGHAQTSAPLSVEARHSPLTSRGEEHGKLTAISTSTSNMGNLLLMAGLVGERREKLVNKTTGGGTRREEEGDNVG